MNPALGGALWLFGYAFLFNVALAVLPHQPAVRGDPSPTAVTVATCAAAGLATGMLVLVAVRIGLNLAELGRLEPLRREPARRATPALSGTPHPTSLA